MGNKDIFTFSVNLIMDGVAKTIDDYNRKNDAEINKELFLASTYKNIYDIGNKNMDKLKEGEKNNGK